MNKFTTLTFGDDVAVRIAYLIGNTNAYEEIFKIVTDKTIQWKTVLNIYLEVIEQHLGYKLNIKISDDYDCLSKKKAHYQIYCDRMYTRIFDNKRIEELVKGSVSEYMHPEIGLNNV